MKPSIYLRRLWLAAASFALSALMVAGCSPQTSSPQFNVLRSVSLAPGESGGIDKLLRFSLDGTGTCESVDVDWGDGDVQKGVVPVPGQRIEFATSNVALRTLTHTYTGWGGGKTVTVTAASGCEGKARVRFNAPPMSRRIGFAQPGTSICTAVMSTPLPTIIPRMLVHLRTIALDPPNHRGINFGCLAAGCVYDADGKAGTSAAAPFPFPGMREYSLVLRIGSQLVQGGTNVQFTTTGSGTLTFCLNDGDNDVTNNLGGYIIDISVDQLGPP